MGSLGFNRIDRYGRYNKQLKSKGFDERNLELNTGGCDDFEKLLRGGSTNMDIDEDYRLYLTYVVGCLDEERPPRVVGDGDDEDEQDLDPHYKMFREKLSECGKSYALEVDEGDGVCVLLKYEGLDDADEGWDWPAQRIVSKARKVGGAKDLRNFWGKEKVENMRCLRSFQEKERKSSMMKQCLKHESFDVNECRKRRRVDQEDNQVSELIKSVGGNKKVESLSGEKRKMNSIPESGWSREPGLDHRALRKSSQKKIKLTTPLRKVDSREKIESRRVLRSSQKEMIPTADRGFRPEPRSDPITFRRSRNTEEDEVQVIDHYQNIQNSRKVENRRVLRSDIRKEKTHSAVEKKLRCEPKLSPQDCRKPRNIIEKEKNEVTNHSRNFKNKRQVDDRSNLRSSLGKGRQNSEAEKGRPINPASHGVKESSRRKLVGEDNGISKSRHNCDTEDITTDGCYQFFLNGIEKEGECVVFVYNGKRVRYEDDDIDNASDSEILMWDHDPYLNQGNNDPFVAAKTNASIDGEDSLFVGVPGEKKISQFRRKVMSILSKPYNRKEYKNLKREVWLRRPIEVHKEMRRPKSVSVDKPSKSYLDHHRDLKREVQRAALTKNRPKVLNILRGFFFWLKNVSNEGEGVFKPWLDKSCLEIVPPPAN